MIAVVLIPGLQNDHVFKRYIVHLLQCLLIDRLMCSIMYNKPCNILIGNVLFIASGFVCLFEAADDYKILTQN